MINKIKSIYPNFLIFIKKGNKVFYLNGKELKDKTVLNNNCVIISNNHYEVHKKKNS